MNWKVLYSRQAQRSKEKLPERVRKTLLSLTRELETLGPVRGSWPNYSKLGPGRHHCHIKKGKPTYVAVWEERNHEIRLIEVTYVGTHEKAPY